MTVLLAIIILIGNNAILGGHVTVEDHAGVMALSAIPHSVVLVLMLTLVVAVLRLFRTYLHTYLHKVTTHATFGLNLVGLNVTVLKKQRFGFIQKRTKRFAQVKLKQKCYQCWKRLCKSGLLWKRFISILGNDGTWHHSLICDWTDDWKDRSANAAVFVF